MTSPNAAPADAERPVDRRVVIGVAVFTAVVGIALSFTGHERLHALQRSFILAGLTLLGLWAMSVAVKTDAGRIRVRSSVIGVVVGMFPVGAVGMVALLLG